MSTIRLVLASASPARFRTLTAAGLAPEVVVSGVDEEQVRADSVAELVAVLARLKAEAVHAGLDTGEDEPLVVLGCDSLLELAGEPLGKPTSAAEATARWRSLSGGSGQLHTGHHVILRRGGIVTDRTAVATTTVHFAELTDEEIAAYVATGEPLLVAGAFTIDGLGGPFVRRIEGDHHNVVGVSLPLLRQMLAELGVPWTDLWSLPPR